MITEQRMYGVFRDRRGEGVGTVKASSIGLFATPRSTGQYDSYRPRPFPGQNTSKVYDFEWKELVTFSRQLFAQMPNVAAAVSQKNVYAVGDAWKPHYKGANAAWGQEAEEWLYDEWFPSCDLRGGVFDFTTNLLLSGISWDVDGDDAMVLTENEGAAGAGQWASERVGTPKLKFIPALSIGSRQTAEMKGGAYDGAKVSNGILLDRNEACIGINILGEKSEDDVTVSARDCDFRFEPEFRSLYRGVPRMSKSILEAFDLQDIHQYLKRQVKINSAQGLIKRTVSGEADPNTDTLTERTAVSGDTSAAPPTDVRIEKLLGGEILYLQAGTNEEIKAFEHSTPHANVQNFMERLDRWCIFSIQWFYELLNPSNLRGANVRLIQDQARTNVFFRQKYLKIRAKRAVRYALSRAMQNKRISKNYDDWWKWTFNFPAQITVDAGYDQQADQTNEKIGSTTLAAITEKQGRFWKDIRRQRVEEAKNKMAAAKELVDEATKIGETLTFREALDMIGSHSAHSVAERIQDEPVPLADQ